MLPTPRIVLSNPGTGVFVQQASRALFEAGLLKCFVTTFVDRSDATWRPWLPDILDLILRKRAITEFPIELAMTHPPRELLRLLAREVDWTHGVLTDAVWEWAEHGFDRWAAAHALDGAQAVYGYEHACLETFRAAHRRGMRCFYEIPAPEIGYALRMRRREIAAHPELDSPYEQRLQRLQGQRLERRRQEWEEADSIIASSEFTKSTYHESGYDVSRVNVIPLAAPPICDEMTLTTRLEKRGPLRFLSMGMFALHKGSHHLLEAWRALDAGQHARLEVVGRLELPAAMLRGLPDTVHLRGAVSPLKAMEIYREADVLVFPTLADGFGMVVNEAMSQGVPVITTPNAGASEVIRHGDNGLIVAPSNPIALKEAMSWCLGHRDSLAGMSIRARETAARWQWPDYRRALAQTVRDGLCDNGVPRARAKPRAAVCLITTAHLASNPRLVKEADALQAAGYRTRVVATNLNASLHGIDQTILARARWNCTLVGRGSLPIYAWLTLRQRAAQWLLERQQIPWKRVSLAGAAHHRLTIKLGKIAAEIPADLYLAHNLGALPAAAYAAKKNGAKLGFDAEDFHSGELTTEQESRGSHEARRILEAAYLNRCDVLTAASPGIAGEYQRLYGVTMQPILNVFPLSEAPYLPVAGHETSVATEKGRILELYWFSQTIGAGRGLEALVAALGQMRHQARLFLRGKPAAGYIEHLRDLARQAGLADAINILPVIPPDELIRASARYDLGLALEMNHPRNRAVCLTNKLFAYLLAGLPVVLSRTPAQEAIYADLQPAAVLIDLDQPEATARSLDEFASSFSMRQSARAAAWRLARERYNWDIEQNRFLTLIRSTLGKAV